MSEGSAIHALERAQQRLLAIIEILRKAKCSRCEECNSIGTTGCPKHWHGLDVEQIQLRLQKQGDLVYADQVEQALQYLRHVGLVWERDGRWDV
jgi:hypothetical protein